MFYHIIKEVFTETKPVIYLMRLSRFIWVALIRARAVRLGAANNKYRQV